MSLCVLICVCIVGVLLITVSWLPPFGDADSPANNEVPLKYLEDGVEDTGAVNIVAGMILDYRAFDTFGESCVLFVAVCAVVALLPGEEKANASSKRYFHKGITLDFASMVRLRGKSPRSLPFTGRRNAALPQNCEAASVSFASKLFIDLARPRQDIILRTTSLVLIPLIMIFGCYVILNGHLSPGGGFSGGAILGSALILHTIVYGAEHAGRFISFKVYRRTVSICLIFYALAKGYSFYTGANHIPSIIPLGTPGKLLSAGLILPLNIAVGLIVACTVYIIYIMFSKGEVE
ncbi:MAG: hypothetical protein FWH00_04420 [Oscillospiraceae bacterium]|nr:hypothetical protein [Oscillospiraceae bacterium]